MNAHEAVRCSASATVQLTVESPTENAVPLGGVQVIVRGASPPVAIGGAYVTRTAWVLVAWAVCGAGHVRNGGDAGGATEGAVGPPQRTVRRDPKRSAKFRQQKWVRRRKLNRHDSIRPMSTRPVSRVAASAMLCAATALWTTFGAIAFADARVGAERVGVLPPLGFFVAFIAAAVATLVIARPTARVVAPLWLSALALVPWLPVPLPLSAFLWSGASRIWLWVAIAAALIALAPRPRGVRPWSPRRSAAIAGLLAGLAYGLGAWAVAPRHPAGDEPHYLVITQSLLADLDLKIENNHRQGDYRDYFTSPLPPHYLRRGTNGEIYSVHAPGLPVLVAPVFALFGYVGVIAALIAASAAGASLTWLLAWYVTRDRTASWFAWAAVTLSVPFFFHAPAVFPDGLGAVLFLVGILPLVDERARRRPYLLAVGAALAILPWLHTRFAILAASTAVALVARLLSDPAPRRARLAALFAVPVVSFAAWLTFFQVIYGTPTPSAPYAGIQQTSIANIGQGVPGLLFDQEFGLLATAPVFLFAIAGLGAMLREEHRRLAVELFAICASYFFAVAAFHMWWGGFSAPARFLVPITLALAIPTAIWFKTRAHPASRIAGVAALVASLLATATIASVDRGVLLFNAHDGASRLAMWWSSAVDLTTALPSLVQRPPVVVLIESAVWLLALAVTVWIGVMVERRGRSTSAIVVSMGFTLAVTASAAVSLVWHSNGAMPVTPASGGSTILRRLDTGSRQLAIRYSPLERLRLDEVAGRITLLRMSYPIDTVAVLNGLPAGVYEVGGRARGSAAGRLRIATERESPPIEDWQMVSLGPSWKRTFVLPVPVSRLRIGADEAAQRALADISIRPLVVPGRRNRLTEDGEAGRGARYGRAVVFRIAGSSYFEPTGFWVLGGTVGEFAVAPDPHSAIRLFVRNAPVDNEVTLESGSWREHWTLAPGEERIVDLPVDARRLGAILTIQSLRGARPVDFDPNSDDERLLGCWIEFR